MIVPLQIRKFRKFSRKPRYVIIHDTSCQSPSDAALIIDSPMPQTNYLRGKLWTTKTMHDVPYHYVIERVKQEIEVVMGRPFGVHCDYDDIPSPYDFSYHIAIMGNYEKDIPHPRLYQKMCYNCLSPMIRMSGIGIKRIFLHSEVSTNKDLSCPGSFFVKDRLMATLKNMLIT